MADIPAGELWITPARGLRDSVVLTVVRLECSCGWMDKCFKQDAVKYARRHNNEKHNGKMKVKGYGGITVA